MKSARHAAILDIIEKDDVETQENLATHLGKRGIRVTQATVSRDIKELRLIKVLSVNGTYKYATVDKAEVGLKERFINIFAHSVVSVQYSGNLIVIKTISGTATAAGETIDSLKWSEIIGTIAGDNTIFIVAKDAALVPELVRRFQSMMHV